MTRHQEWIKQRNARIRAEYSEMQRTTDMKAYAIFLELADKYGLEPRTIEGVVWDKKYCSVSEYAPK